MATRVFSGICTDESCLFPHRDSNLTSSDGVMLVTNELHRSPAGGRELLCKLNHDALKKIYGDRLVVFELQHSRLQGFKSIVGAFFGDIDGLNAAVIKRSLQIINEKKVVKVFVDGSNLGGFVKVAKRRFPQLEISTFFHNVEARFFLGSLRRTKSCRSLAVLLVNYLAERKTVRYSDKRICLSERDSRLLQEVYGRSATHISPMAMKDTMPIGFDHGNKPSREKFALFVGGTFYANRAGIAWFVKHVMPQIHIKTCIVGRGFEALRQELECDGQVEVIGAVEHLADWYRAAHFVIAPIFDGSGMKTKVAEALMYGKKIIGTPEAFSGYEDIAGRAGWVCSTANEFVTAISLAQKEVSKSFDPELRAIYDEKYSLTAATVRLAEILASAS